MSFFRPDSSLISAAPAKAARALGLLALVWLITLCVSSSAMAFDNSGFAHVANRMLSFTTDEKLSSLVFGLFMGVMLTASAYLFFIWIVMRDRGQVFLMFLLLCLSANIGSTNDALMGWMGMGHGTLRGLVANYSLILSCVFSAVFTYYFLEADINLPLFRIPLAVLCLALIGLLFYSAIDQTLVRFVLPTLGVLTIDVVLTIGAISLFRGISGSLTHIIAFLFFLVGLLGEPMYNMGYFTEAVVGQNLTYIAFSMAAMMFAIVTASQFAARQEEKERALAISNERFTLATRGANEGLFDWNIRTGEVFFSDQFRKIIGFRLENKTQSLKIWLRLMQPDDRRIVREALRRFRQNAATSTVNVEYRVVLAGEKRRWLHTKVVALRDNATKKVTRLVGSTSDVTARKQSEVALRASEMRFRSITEAHPVPVMIVGLRYGTVLYASPSSEELLRLSQSDLLQRTFERFLPDDQARLEIWEIMGTGHEINLKEVKLMRGNGRPVDAALSARRISYQNEDAMVIGIYDLSERKEAEAQIARQQEALQQSEKMAALGGLLAGVAHELNNPLSVVVGQATLLMEGSPEPKVVARADKIYKAADRCARIVKSFLALARRKPPERKPMDLNEIISNSLELLGYQIRTGNIEVVMELQPDLPAVAGDADQMTQVVTNLVLNASQAMLTWKGAKRITIRTSTDGADQVTLLVSDTGPGVPPEIRTRIFEPFFTTKSGTGGTGVGLSLCLNIVASHGGQLAVEDTPGGGATFLISLPMVGAATETEGAVNVVPAQAADNNSPTVGVTAQPKPAEAKSISAPLRILLVDDEFELAQTLAELLEPDGSDVDIAINGAVALEKLHKREFDVIVSDLRMPVLDGPGLYEALVRELPSYTNKIIYVTGDTLSTHVQAFLKQYPVPVIDKPYRLVDVKKAIDDLIKRNAVPLNTGAS